MIPELVSTPGMDFLKVKDVYSPGSHIGLGWNTVNYGWGWRRLTKSTCTHTYSYLRVRVCACVSVMHLCSMCVINVPFLPDMSLGNYSSAHSNTVTALSLIWEIFQKKKNNNTCHILPYLKKKKSPIYCVWHQSHNGMRLIVMVGEKSKTL